MSERIKIQWFGDIDSATEDEILTLVQYRKHLVDAAAKARAREQTIRKFWWLYRVARKNLMAKRLSNYELGGEG